MKAAAAAVVLKVTLLNGIGLINIEMAYIQYDIFKVFLSGDICIAR